jgi:hypothetical protein
LTRYYRHLKKDEAEWKKKEREAQKSGNNSEPNEQQLINQMLKERMDAQEQMLRGKSQEELDLMRGQGLVIKDQTDFFLDITNELAARPKPVKNFHHERFWDAVGNMRRKHAPEKDGEE